MAKLHWQQLNSPKTIFSIARAGNLGWILGTNEGVWRLVDGACTILSEMLRPAAITSVTASPQFPMHPQALAGAADGIAFSTDEGVTWTGAIMPQSSQIASLATSPSYPMDGLAFAATFQDGVLCTQDHGASWQSWNYGLLDLETSTLSVSPNFTTDETVIVSTVRGLFRSTNGGRAWRELPFPKEGIPVSSSGITAKLLIAGSESNGLYYSADVGNTWYKRNSFKAGPINALAISPDGNWIAVATPAVVAVTQDGGTNWIRAEGHTPQGILSLSVNDDASIVCGTQEDGLWIYA